MSAFVEVELTGLCLIKIGMKVFGVINRFWTRVLEARLLRSQMGCPYRRDPLLQRFDIGRGEKSLAQWKKIQKSDFCLLLLRQWQCILVV